jgi:hypothetical protein
MVNYLMVNMAALKGQNLHNPVQAKRSAGIINETAKVRSTKRQ